MPGNEPVLTVFIDRDGVVNENRDDYVKSWQEFVFVPGSIEAIASLSRTGVRVFIATNQSVVGRGLISKRQLDDIHDRMLDVLTGSGGKVEEVLTCVHHPQDACICRKPAPGLLTDAAKTYGVDMRYAIVIGDHSSDIEAGAAAGAKTVLVRTGRGTEVERAQRWGTVKPDFVADDLVDAALWVLAQKALLSAGSREGVLQR